MALVQKFPHDLAADVGELLNRHTSLGRQTLAALGTSPGDDLRPSRRRHALAEAVAALSDELAWLIGAFHRENSVAGRQ